MIYPRFLDVEASSLNTNSYPIEVAWSDQFGNIECHLINPYHVHTWTDWDFASQEIHGISRKMCREQGISPASLCKIMSRSIQPGEQIYADGGPFDEYWIDELFGAGTELGFAQFKIVHSDSVTLALLKNAAPNINKILDLYDNLKIEARNLVNGRHRAAVDVEYLIELYKLCFDISRTI